MTEPDVDQRAAAARNLRQLAVPFLQRFVADQNIGERFRDGTVAVRGRVRQKLDLVRFRLRRDDLLLRLGVGDDKRQPAWPRWR